MRFKENVQRDFYKKANVQKKLALGLCFGIGLARLWLDFFSPDGVAILCFLIGLVVGYLRPHWSLLGVFVYVASPFPIPHLAVLAFSFTVSGFVLATKKRIKPFSYLGGGGVIGLVAFLIFLSTLSPGLLPADAGEFQVVAAEWGVAHPPGYPLYTIFAGLTAHLLPFETMAWRVNLFSALTSTITVMIVAYTVQRQTQKIWAGWLAGLALLTSITFWMTSTQASIRPMTALFTALMVEAALAYRTNVTNTTNLTFRAVQIPRSSPALLRFGIAAGLGVTHHGSLFFMGFALALSIVLADLSAWKKWSLAVGGALVGLLPLLYFPLRADGLLAPADLNTWDGFWKHVLARGFANDMFAYRDPSDWPERWQVMSQVYLLQWHTWLLIFALLGLVWAIWRERGLGFTLLSAFLTHSIVVGTYRAPQTVEYALPAYVILVIALGYFAGKIKNLSVGTRSISSTLPQMLLGTFIVSTLFFSFQTGYRTMQRLAAQEEARDAALATLQQTPENGLILSSWHRATPLWYLQQVENHRTDAAVRYVNPEGALSPIQRWVKLIEESLTQNESVTVTQNFPEAYRVLPYTRQNEQFLATPNPIIATENTIGFDSRLALVTPAQFETHLTAGDSTHFALTWHIFSPVPAGEISTFVHIGAAEQPPIAQQDLILQINAAGNLTLFYEVLLPITAPPGKWQVWAGAYDESPILTQTDEARILLGTVTLHPAEFPAPTQHPVFRPTDSATLIGWDTRNTPDNETTLFLHWQLPGKNQNYTVQISDVAGGLWAATSATTQNRIGYWTSIHRLPDAIAQAGITIHMNEQKIKLPPANPHEQYILFGHIAALIDWNVKFEGKDAVAELTFLPFGASYEDIQIQLAGPTTADFTPVSGSIPSFKWAYNRAITSVQTLKNSQSQDITLLLYDGLTGQVLPIFDGQFIGNIVLAAKQ